MSRREKDDTASKPMTLAECASYLHLSENTVLKLAQGSHLPGVLVGRKWRFERKTVDDWLGEELGDGTGHTELEDLPDSMQLPLEDLMPIEAIIEDLKATTALGAVEELAARAYSNKWLHEKPWFVGGMVEREALAATAMEGGTALLHTHAREAEQVARPFIIFGRSYNGIDFGAEDGKPTFLFFLLGLKYDRLHLPILGRLARSMRKSPATAAKLRSLPSSTKIRALLLKKDAESRSTSDEADESEELRPSLDRKQRLRAIMRVDAQRKHRARQAEEAKKKAEKKASSSKKKTKASKASKAAATEESDVGADASAGKKSSTKKASAKKASSKKAPAKKAAVKKASAKKKAAKKAPVETAPASETAAPNEAAPDTDASGVSTE